MRIAGVGHAVFAATIIAFGIFGLVAGDFTTIWQPVPATIPARAALAYLSALVFLASGIGVLVTRTATAAARVLLVVLLLWLALLRVPAMLVAPNVGTSWAAGKSAVMLAAAWVLYVWFATDWDRRRFGLATGENGLRIARVLFGMALIPFGLAHFVFIQRTASLVPAWLPAHVVLGYFTGWTFIVAGVAMLVGVCARTAAALSTLQMAIFLLLVWAPIIAAGSRSASDWGETTVTLAVTVAAWVVADSYRMQGR